MVKGIKMHWKYNITEKPIKLYLTRKEARLIHTALNIVEAQAIDNDDEMHDLTDELESVNLKVVNAIH
tara:strand:+ start:399 stop:602 length:204 start_codon:yes stop_codon:yes gene_type:complete